MNYTLMAFYGEIGINAFSIISYLSSFTMAVFFGASEGMQPLFGQAYGSEKKDDLKYYFRAGQFISIAGSALCVAIYVLFPHFLCRLFGADGETLTFTAIHMWEYCWGFIVGSINTMMSAYFTKRSSQAIALNTVCSLIMNSLIITFLPKLLGSMIVWHTFGIYEVLVLAVALISSIYGIVDMAMVGQYQGPEGTAAMAVVSPIWNIIYSLGLLMGIGGSILFSTLRGESEENRKRSNEYFTAALIGLLILAAVTWIAVIFFDRELLILFGGIFNVFGDYFFVFVLNLGIMGAGISTAMGSVFSLLVMLSHFAGKKNTLRLVKPTHLFAKLKTITIPGFSTFFIDVAMGILTVLFNRQILKYLGEDALATAAAFGLA